jgi:hypothetical protein
MKTNINENLKNLQLSDIYTLMLFILYKVKDIPEYAVLSELCFLLDGPNLIRLLTYFEGKTITVPTSEEFNCLINALLLYQYINADHLSVLEAQNKLKVDSPTQKEAAMELYLQLLPVLSQYNFNRNQVSKNDR